RRSKLRIRVLFGRRFANRASTWHWQAPPIRRWRQSAISRLPAEDADAAAARLTLSSERETLRNAGRWILPQQFRRKLLHLRAIVARPDRSHCREVSPTPYRRCRDSFLKTLHHDGRVRPAETERIRQDDAQGRCSGLIRHNCKIDIPLWRAKVNICRQKLVL